MKILLIVPAFNEGSNVEKVIKNRAGFPAPVHIVMLFIKMIDFEFSPFHILGYKPGNHRCLCEEPYIYMESNNDPG